MSSSSQTAPGLYQKEEKIYPREVKGTYATLRRLAMVLLLGVFYLGPWLEWNNRQAVLFDLPERKFYIFGLTLWPQDFLYLALLLIMAAITLFFFTALLGRVWCGYACPQTVWTEAFVWIEQRFEGNRNRRIKLDKAGWSLEKFARKGGKQLTWVVFALFTGFTFVGYFTPIHELGQKILSASPGPWELFWVLFYGFATYGNAGFMREQVCKYMCPYARFQSSMFDKDTLIVTYDQKRGEPRGGRGKKVDPATLGLGDCVDCTLCVQVCPTGIDIRKGLQYECIACAACVDACDQVMEKMSYPKGLIRYSTEHAMTGKPTRVVRTRVIIYGLILSLLVGGFITLMQTKQPLILDVLRDRNTLFRDVGRLGIENSFTLHILNKDDIAHTYQLSVDGIDGIELVQKAPITIPAETMYTLPVAVRVPQEFAKGGNDILFTLQATDQHDIVVTEDSRFRGPTHY